MPPLAAAATECRLSAGGMILKQEETDPVTTGRPCTVRLHGEVVVTYLVRAVGGPERARLVQEDPPMGFDQVFYLYDPEAFFGSLSSCRDIVHQMLARTPVVGDFDLAADNWDGGFLPHDLASIILVMQTFGSVLDGVAPRSCYSNVDVCVTVRVRAVYSEPKALLLACKEVTAAYCRVMAAREGADASLATRECCVCMEDLAAFTDGSSDTVMLPCSHVFHNQCLVPWFSRRSTCPMCRRNMIMYLVAATKTPKGRFPGLEC
jgi:hypothetical protein